MSYEGMRAALIEIRNLMQRYQRPQLELVKRILHQFGSDVASFDRNLTSDSTWSGPGSIWQISFYESAHHTKEDARADELKFHNALVRLVENMINEGLSNEQAEKVAKASAMWVRLHSK